jgi:hypothetical protein
VDAAVKNILFERGGYAMDTMWKKVKKGLREGAVYSMEKIEELSKIGKLKVEAITAKRKITRNFIDIGERAFDLIESGKGSESGDDLAVKTSMENIRSLRQEIEEINRKIAEIQERAKKAGNAEEDDEITGV